LVEIPYWAVALEMAHGDPLRAKEIYTKLDKVWYRRWMIYKSERATAKVPDEIVGMYNKE